MFLASARQLPSSLALLAVADGTWNICFSVLRAGFVIGVVRVFLEVAPLPGVRERPLRTSRLRLYRACVFVYGHDVLRNVEFLCPNQPLPEWPFAQRLDNSSFWDFSIGVLMRSFIFDRSSRRQADSHVPQFRAPNLLLSRRSPDALATKKLTSNITHKAW